MSSTSKQTNAIEVFYSYAHADEHFQKEIEKQLSVLKLQGKISDWYDRKIIVGEPWENQIDTHLNTAQIILLLISADFMASKYCVGKEMMRAMERHEAGEARVIPIIVSHVLWYDAPFGKLQALPRNAKPVISWSPRSKAYADIAKGINKVAEELLAKQAAEEARIAQEEAELLAKKAQEEAELLAKQPVAEETSKLVEVELAKKRAKELAEKAVEAEQEAKKATEEARIAQEEAEQLSQDLSTSEPSTDENKTFWEILQELLKKDYTSKVSEIIDKCAERTLALGHGFVDSRVFFEMLLQIPDSLVAQMLHSHGYRAEKITAIVNKENEKRRHSTPAITSEKDLGLSKSVLEILVYARLLAYNAGQERARESELLDAFVLQRGNEAARFLAKEMKIDPEMLLREAFLANGEVNSSRFSTEAQTILDNVLRLAQEHRIVGSSHLIAALSREEGSLARKMLWILGHEPEGYVRRLLKNTQVRTQSPLPTKMKLTVCSTRARNILNLAELFARMEKTAVDEDHLLKAYLHCTDLIKK